MTEILVQVSHPTPEIVQLSLNRPQKRNALNVALLEELARQLEGLPPTVRGLLLCGEGAAFCTGMDLAECSDPAVAGKSAQLLAFVFEKLYTMPVISVAVVHGSAFAGGAGLMLACDAAIGSHDLQIAFPETQRGLVPVQVMSLLRRRVSGADLQRLLLFCDTIDATHAYQMGLLMRIVPQLDLHNQALLVLQHALLGAPEAVRHTKKLLVKGFPKSLGEELQEATHIQTKVRLSAEAREGSAAFLEKRAPFWAAAIQQVE